MKNPLVLVVDPFNSPLKGHIKSIVKSQLNFNCQSINIKDLKLNEIRVIPGLVILLLDQCEDENFNITDFIKLPEIFPSIPIVCIVDTKKGHHKFVNCQSFAWSFLTYPVSENDIKLLVDWYVKVDTEIIDDSVELLLKEGSMPDLFIGESQSVNQIKSKMIKISPYDVTVLLQGETGTGKELCAKLIHFLSKRSQGPFVAINCAAIPPELFENELFGHRRGAYTNANSTESGVVHSAEGGTLFLDEIESLSESSQIKLLRFIEEKKYRPLGDPTSCFVNVRIVAATNKNLNDLVESGKFREDLLHRLSVVRLTISPLRERKIDIPLLTSHFIRKYSILYSKNIQGIRPDAMMYLTNYHWPGNIRELENILQEAIIINTGEWIKFDDLNFNKTPKELNVAIGSMKQMKKLKIEEYEKNYLTSALKIFKGNVELAAQFAQKDRREFYRLMKKYKIKQDEYRVHV